MVRRHEEAGNLWLARALWEVGAVRFGDFTIGRSTVHSPVYINVRRLIGRPRILRRASLVMAREVQAELARLHPTYRAFQLVAGVPMGGLHVATAYSLTTNTPMIYANPRQDANRHYTIEGHYEPDQVVLIIDDLITSGGSVLETGALLQQEGLQVRDALVLIDRGEGAAARLKQHGYSLHCILSLEVMLNYYLSTQRIDQNLHKKCIEYIGRKRHEYAGNN